MVRKRWRKGNRKKKNECGRRNRIRNEERRIKELEYKNTFLSLES